MDAVDIDRFERAQVCLQKARAKPSNTEMLCLASELMYHLDMMLRLITSFRLMSGELDDAQLVLTPRARALASPPLSKEPLPANGSTSGG